MQDNYLRAIKADSTQAQAYYTKSLQKTMQQEALESLLQDLAKCGEIDYNAPYNIADLACGGGTLSYHLSKIFPNAHFTLLDFNDEALKISKKINADNISRMTFIEGDLRALPFADSAFDFIFCWQSLGWVDRQDLPKILGEMLRILKPSGRLYASSLFNTEFDVDIYTQICDRTRPSSEGSKDSQTPLINGNYNTYCQRSIKEMVGDVKSLEILPFFPHMDITRDFRQRGIGSFTLAIDGAESNLLREDFSQLTGGGQN